MTYQQALSVIHSQGRFSKTTGLKRISRLLELLGSPQEKLQFVHIAGTNGKGSTTTMIAEALTASGKKTGKFISPYVIEFRERIQIDDVYIPEEALAELTEKLLPFVRQTEKELGDSINEFELTTALAFCWFARQNCDCVVLEVGLGGRGDATNVIRTPLVSVISTIDFDHTQVLGDTLEQIAAEKCGIIKTGGVTVSNPIQPREAAEVIERFCKEKENPLIFPGMEEISAAEFSLRETQFTYQGVRWKLSLIGKYQAANAVTAIEACRQLGLSQEAIQEGLSKAFIPARMEVLSEAPLILLDGAHNLSGARALAGALEGLGCRDAVAVTGMLREKDWVHTLEALLPFCEQVVALTPENPRALPGEELAEWVRKQGCPAVFASSCRQAYEQACALLKEGQPLLIFGSLYLAADMRQVVLEQEKP